MKKGLQSMFFLVLFAGIAVALVATLSNSAKQRPLAVRSPKQISVTGQVSTDFDLTREPSERAIKETQSAATKSPPTQTPNIPPHDVRNKSYTEQGYEPGLFETSVPEMRLTPFPSPLPLPTYPPDDKRIYASQNLKFKIEDWSLLLSKISTEQLNTADVAWSPDGETLAVALATGDVSQASSWKLCLLDKAGNFLKIVGNGYAPVWSPTSKFIAYERNDSGTRNLVIVTVDTSEQSLPDQKPASNPYVAVAWLSANEFIYRQNTEAKDIMLIDLGSGKINNVTAQIAKQFTSSDPNMLSSLPTKNLLVAASPNKVIVFQRQDEQFIPLTQINDGADIDKPQLAPDGDHLAYSSSKRRALIITSLSDTTQNQVIMPLPGRSGPGSLFWSADGVSLLYVDSEGVHSVNQDGSGLTLVLPNTSETSSSQISWSSQGALAAIQMSTNSFALNLIVGKPANSP